MGKTSAGHPELLVEAHGVNDERVTFPLPNRGSVVTGYRFRRRDGRASICIDHAPIPVSASVQNKNSAHLRLFDELKSVGHLKLPWTAWRQAPSKGIVLQQH